jgi:hypothetical protein
MRQAYDESEAVVGEGYQVSGDSIDPSKSSSSNIERYREQLEIDNYNSNMPTRPAHYMSNEDTSSDSGNGFDNLTRKETLRKSKKSLS